MLLLLSLLLLFAIPGESEVPCFSWQSHPGGRKAQPQIRVSNIDRQSLTFHLRLFNHPFSIQLFIFYSVVWVYRYTGLTHTQPFTLISTNAGYLESLVHLPRVSELPTLKNSMHRGNI